MALQSDYGRAQTSRVNYAALQLRKSTYLGFASSIATYPLHKLKRLRIQTSHPPIDLPKPYLSALMKSAALSATAYTKLARFPLTCNGNTLASTTRRFLVPCTTILSLTTPPSSLGPIAQVPMG